MKQFPPGQKGREAGPVTNSTVSYPLGMTTTGERWEAASDASAHPSANSPIGVDGLVEDSGPDPRALRGVEMSQPVHRGQLRFLVFSASLRSDSLNTDLATLAAMTIRAKGGDVDLASMADFDCPSYNQDVQVGHGFPEVAHEFRRRLEACDGLVISSPEYNGSMPGALKNSIDWLSRFNPQPFNERHALLLSASPSMIGGTGDSGRCASHSSIWGLASTQTCSRLPRPTSPSTPTERSRIRSCNSASRPTWRTSWTWSRPPSSTHASRGPGSNFSASASTPTRTAYKPLARADDKAAACVVAGCAGGFRPHLHEPDQFQQPVHCFPCHLLKSSPAHRAA